MLYILVITQAKIEKKAESAKLSAIIFEGRCALNNFLSCLYHAPDAEDDEGNGENLSHVNGQRGLEGFLYLLSVLNEEAEGEDVGQAEAEVPAGAYLGVLGAGCWVLGVGAPLVDDPQDDLEQGVGVGLVELAGMARQLVYLLKNKSPGHVGGAADNLAVH